MTLDVECLFHQRLIDLVEQKKFILQTKLAEKIIQMMFFTEIHNFHSGDLILCRFNGATEQIQLVGWK